MAPLPAYSIPVRGSFGIGFVVGLFGACVGLAFVLALAKGPDTRKGAAVGFGVFLVLCMLGQVTSTLAR